jgi:hypothetical protein
LNKNVRTINYLAMSVSQAFIFLVAKLLRNASRYDLPNGAKACPSASFAWLKNVNRRTVDVTASRQKKFYLYSHELTGDLAEVQSNLFAMHRIATVPAP